MKELLKYIGRTALLRVENNFKVTVTIVDLKMSWGKLRIEVAPVAGEGTMFVEQERLEIQ